MKKGTFEWTKAAHNAIEIIKQKLCESLILAIPDFDEMFEVECDASGDDIGVVVTQIQRPLAYFNEKIHGRGGISLPMIGSFMQL